MELWGNSTSDDQKTGTGPAEPEQPQIRQKRSAGKKMRLSEHATGLLLRVWLWNSYIPAYCRILTLSRIFRRCYIIDALGNSRSTQIAAIEQTIEHGTEEILQQQREANFPHPITLQTLLLTGKGKTIENSSTAVLEHIPVSWHENTQEILARVESSPTIFLLNPCMPQLFTPDDLQAIFQRSLPGEYCFIFWQKQIEQTLRNARKRQEISAALTALLRSDHWKSLQGETDEDVQRFISLFAKAMQRYFPWQPQQIRLHRQNGRASTTPLPFTILFATRRPDSLQAMNDAVCTYQRAIEETSFKGTLSEEWFLQQRQQKREHNIQQLQQQIQQQGTLRKIRHWPQLRQYSMLQHFGEYLQREYDSCIQQLIEDRQVRCLWHRVLPAKKDPEQASAPPQIPGNDDTLLWSQKK